MNKLCIFFLCAAIAITMAGCGAATIAPNYSSMDAELMRIGGDTPVDKEPEIVNLGSYCLKVTERWKADGKTPDGQTIWSKDSLRIVTPCK